MHRRLDAFTRLAEACRATADPHARLSRELFNYLSSELDRHQFDSDVARRHALRDFDIDINTQGLLHWALNVA